MKSKLFMTALVAGAVAFSSCTKKIDEKTMAEVTQFGTDWTALGEKASTWSNELTTTATAAKEFATKQTEQMASMSEQLGKDAAMKTQMEASVAAANADAAKFEGMTAEWTQWKATWDEQTKAFGEWKDKLTKGEVTAEDATKGIADWKTKMSDASAKVDSWSTAYAEAKSSCEKNMAAAQAMMMPTEPAKK